MRAGLLAPDPGRALDPPEAVSADRPRVIRTYPGSRGDWRSLMVGAQRGEAAPYRRLLGLIRPWLIGYFSRRLPSAMVEDAVQETLITIHHKRHTYDAGRPLEAWLVGIAHYKWVDQIRAMKPAGFNEPDESLAVEEHHSAVVSATILKRLLAGLKPAQSQAIRLVKIEGFSIREAAIRSGQSSALVKVNVHRGIAKMVGALTRAAP
ncbi:MAG: sigma-70 family RNA polymerase sigma factor [Caulobacteraceae bacterium]